MTCGNYELPAEDVPCGKMTAARIGSFEFILDDRLNESALDHDVENRVRLCPSDMKKAQAFATGKRKTLRFDLGHEITISFKKK